MIKKITAALLSFFMLGTMATSVAYAGDSQPDPLTLWLQELYDVTKDLDPGAYNLPFFGEVVIYDVPDDPSVGHAVQVNDNNTFNVFFSDGAVVNQLPTPGGNIISNFRHIDVNGGNLPEPEGKWL